MEDLYHLLQSHQLLIGHPNLKNLQREVTKSLAELDASFAPKAIPTPVTNPIVSTPVAAEVPDEPAIERRI